MPKSLTPVIPFNETVPDSKTKAAPVSSSVKVNGGIQANGTVDKASVWDKRSDAAAWQLAEVEQLPLQVRLETAVLVLLAVIDNACCYATYFSVRAFHNRLYNIVDLHLVLLPFLDMALLIFSAIGTAHFFLLILLVECLHLPLFHETMNSRFVFSSAPCAVMCLILVYYSEQSQTMPLCALTVTIFMVFCWCVHMRVRYAHQLNLMSKISLDTSWFLALIFGVILWALYLTNSLHIITKSQDLQCPRVDNVQMPVKALTLNSWFCAPWDANAAQHISRSAVNNVPVLVSCSDSFVNRFGVSIGAHKVQCPVGCLSGSSTLSIMGCDIYTADSSICLAAIQTGVLGDDGGIVTVFGRLGVPSFSTCSKNSVTSLPLNVIQVGSTVMMTRSANFGSSVASPSVLGNDGTQLPQAFHFNNLPINRELLWLKKYQKVDSNAINVRPGQPWTQVEGTVSMRLAGIELEDEKVHLGAANSQETGPIRCRASSTGVLCGGSGSAVVQLDFCQPGVKSCTSR